jgi:hypothetical protein
MSLSQEFDSSADSSYHPFRQRVSSRRKLEGGGIEVGTKLPGCIRQIAVVVDLGEGCSVVIEQSFGDHGARFPNGQTR